VGGVLLGPLGPRLELWVIAVGLSVVIVAGSTHLWSG